MKRALLCLFLLAFIGLGAFAQVTVTGDFSLFRDETSDGKLTNANLLNDYSMRLTGTKLIAFAIGKDSVLIGDVYSIGNDTYAILVNQSVSAIAVYYGLFKNNKVSGTWFNLITGKGGDFELRPKS